MPHIHTEPGQHDHTASAFIVRTDTIKPHLLLHMHRKVGKLLQPGGHIELNETPWGSIKHELIEETGYAHDQLFLMQPPIRKLSSLTNAEIHPFPLCHNTHDYMPTCDHRHTDISYLFVTNQDPIGLPEEGESTDFRWVTLDDLEKLDDSEIASNCRQIGTLALLIVENKEWIKESKSVATWGK